MANKIFDFFEKCDPVSTPIQIILVDKILQYYYIQMGF